MLCRSRHRPYGLVLSTLLVCASLFACVTIPIKPTLGQSSPQRSGATVSVRAADLATLVTRSGATAASDESFEAFRDHIFRRRRSEAGKIVAFEENRWFVYAMADMTREAADAQTDGQAPSARRFRRVFLLKPSTVVVEDVIQGSNPESPIRWALRSTEKPQITAGQFRVAESDLQIIGQTVYPDHATTKETAGASRDNRPTGFRVEVTSGQLSGNARFLHVFQLGSDLESNAVKPANLTKNDGDLKLSVAGNLGSMKLTLPDEYSTAGAVEITASDGTALLPRRLLPSGVMPHGLEGAKLMERWDAPYRRDQLPGWDVERPSTHLVRAVEDKTFKPGRAIVFGCGSGNNAIYLASKGFEVTGVDVSPTALAIAAQKAAEAVVQVEWVLADVVALPKLQPYDLIFDRGCYHHICQYDSPAYVKSLCQLSHTGTRAMILAGRPADGSRGGPPRIEEATIRGDFSTEFEFQWLQKIHFDSRNPNARSAEAWSIHLRRKDR